MKAPLLSVSLFLPAVKAQTVVFDGCDVGEYYSGLLEGSANPLSWSREEIQSLLQSTHRRYLPYTDRDDDDDVWKALIDLDASSEKEGHVNLIYRDITMEADTRGKPNTWNREHVWPKSLGVYKSGRDLVDIHHLRPSDWNINSARGNKYFGDCRRYRNANSGDCEIPAIAETAPDTAADTISFLPPANVRGDVARMIMYVDVRYSGGLQNEENLRLVDCPEGDNQMGYLFILLQWHQQDPVSQAETERNNRACERWQGNRNPFVDYPELADSLFVSNGGGDCFSEVPGFVEPPTPTPEPTPEPAAEPEDPTPTPEPSPDSPSSS